MPTQNSEQALSASQIVAEARKNIPEITVAQAREELDQGQVGLLLDVREPAETLKKMGYTNVVNMAGGFNEWSKQGFPVEEGTIGVR
jgi:rhodanese-related sulfurtransferase